MTMQGTLQGGQQHENSGTDLPGPQSCVLTRFPPGIAGLITIAFYVWMFIVLALGARMAYQDLVNRLPALGSSSSPVAEVTVTGARSTPDSTVKFAAAAGIIYLVVGVATLLCQLIRPRFTIAVTGLFLIAIFIVGATVTRALAATLAATVIIAVSWMAGDLALRLTRAPAIDAPLTARTSVRLSLGLGLVGTGVLFLGVFNAIALLTVAIVALIIVMSWLWLNYSAIMASYHAVKRSSASPPQLTWFEAILLALGAALLLFASLATLTPETIYTASDSVRQHLPQAREIWQGRAILVYPTMDGGGASVLGASLNAVTYGLGGFTSVRILQVFLSLGSLIAIAGLGTELADRRAGIAAAAIFSALPLVLWLTGHAYPDLLAVLLICASAQCALLWQKGGQPTWLLFGGVLGGFSLATKQISAVVVLALLVALVITARPRATILTRIQSASIFAIASVVTALPWFIRTAILTGNFPLLGTLRAQLANVPMLQNNAAQTSAIDAPVAQLSTVANVFSGGVTRSLVGVIQGPWDLTFHGAFSNWQSVRVGEFGVVLLMFLPLIFACLCSRGVVMLAITSFLSYVGWVFTIQIPRHLLPSLALLAVLAGISVSRATSERSTFSRLQPGRLVQVCAVLGLALTPFFYLPNSTTQIPISVLTGAESPEEFLTRVDPSSPALRDATALLPPDAPVAYIGEWLGDQSLTEARLIFLGAYSPNPEISLNSQLGKTSDQIFASLARMGIKYVIWDRPETRPQDIETTFLSGDFLLRYAFIIGGDNGIYLYELHPSGIADPTAGKNLVEDPGFASLRKSGNVWNGTRRDLSDNGVFSPRRDSAVSQRVDVVPGQSYLIVLSGSCETPQDEVNVSLTWRDNRDAIISATADDLAFGSALNSSFMWRIAPDNAVTADVGIAKAAGSPCLVRTIGMYAYRDP